MNTNPTVLLQVDQDDLRIVLQSLIPQITEKKEFQIPKGLVYITTRQVADILGVHVNTVRIFVEKGQLTNTERKEAEKYYLKEVLELKEIRRQLKGADLE